MNVALIGSVSSSAVALRALVESEVAVCGVLGLDESLSDGVSDYASLRPIAEGAGIPFLPFQRVSEPGIAEFIGARQVDLLWVIGLSQLVPDRLIAMATHGAVGFHPTMLPRGRGRAPVAWTIILGERAGVTLFILTDRPDAGDIIAQREVPVLPGDYSADLIARTNDVLFDVVTELAPKIKSGDIPRTPQQHELATYYGKRTPADGLIWWNRKTELIHRLIRAAGKPYPGAFTFLGSRKVTVWRGQPAEMAGGSGSVRSSFEPGTILQRDAESGILVQTLDGGLWLTEVEGISGGDAREGDRFAPCLAAC